MQTQVDEIARLTNQNLQLLEEMERQESRDGAEAEATRRMGDTCGAEIFQAVAGKTSLKIIRLQA